MVIIIIYYLFIEFRYITGFEEIDKLSVITIVGKIKLKNILTAMKTTTDPLNIYLFYNQHATDILNEGFILNLLLNSPLL